jgi:hypothetical protein
MGERAKVVAFEPRLCNISVFENEINRQYIVDNKPKIIRNIMARY